MNLFIKIAIFSFFFLLSISSNYFGTAMHSLATHFNIGTLYGTGTQQWRNLKHAIDEWNAKNANYHGFEFNLINPTDFDTNLDIRFCDIIQHNLVALYVPFGEGIGQHNGRQIAEFQMALSMCKRFRIPCLVDRMPASIEGNQFVHQIGPSDRSMSRALVQLVLRMMWSSFILLYKYPNDLSELLSLFALWRRSSSGSRVSFRLLQLPTYPDPNRYALFLKHIRERLRQTNIIVYTNDLGTVHSVLAQASRLNMTETRHSYLVANMDLRLLEDFLGPEYHCNITGFQFVRHQPLIKLDLGLALETVATVGAAISSLRHRRQLEPQSQQLLCDAGDQWADGMLLREQLKRVELGKGERIGRELMGITRMPNGSFTEIGEWNDQTRRWTFDENYDEKNKWRFRMTERGVPDLRGEKLRVVVYLEEPFVMRKMLPPKTSVSSDSSIGSTQQSTNKFDTLQQRGWPTANRYEDEEDDGQLYEGFCIDLLKEMAKLLNFTYEIMEVDDGAYGVEKYRFIVGRTNTAETLRRLIKSNLPP